MFIHILLLWLLYYTNYNNIANNTETKIFSFFSRSLLYTIPWALVIHTHCEMYYAFHRSYCYSPSYSLTFRLCVATTL